MSDSTISAAALQTALATRDLTDPGQGAHAVSLVVGTVSAALAELWGRPPRILRPNQVVSVSDNYDDLGYPPDAPARSARYARYTDGSHLLRTHTTSAIPAWIASIKHGTDEDAVLIPGMVWRRDCVDRRHVGDPHQLDAWRLVRSRKTGRADLLAMIAAVVEAVLPGTQWRANETEHPYTEGGLEVEALVDGHWVEILECGLACSRLLERKGLNPAEWSGLAMGIGLDRMVMVAKGIDDIRLLRSENPRIARQMTDLSAWKPVSLHRAASRDLSVARAPGSDDEELGDLLRDALGADVQLVEEAAIVGRWTAGELPPAARARLGMTPGQENLLVRLTVRSADGPVPKDDCARVYSTAYAALHQGSERGYA